MDYNLYIIISKEDLKQVGISEIIANWGGENIPYDPRRFMFEDKVQMLLLEHEMITQKEKPVSKNQVILKIINGLRELEWEINQQTERLKSNNIIKMLQKICQLDKFSLYIFKDDEIIKQQIRYTKEKDILLLISEALKWESAQNIRIYYE